MLNKVLYDRKKLEITKESYEINIKNDRITCDYKSYSKLQRK